MKAKYGKKDNFLNKSDLSKTNILFDLENRDNSIINNFDKLKSINKEANVEENIDLYNNDNTNIEQYKQLKAFITVQLAFKRFLALRKRMTLKAEKEELKKKKDYYCTDHLRDFLNANNRKGVSIKVLKVKNNYKYMGGIKNGKKDGFGVQKWTNNSKYVGIYSQDFAEGIGKFRFDDGKMQIGFYLANKANGFGISYLNQDLINYQGDFINDKRHGIGIDYLEGKISYKGEFKNDGRSGVGSILYGENAFYLGEWKTGMQNGFGIYTFPDNSVYQGEWLDGKMHGYGEYHCIEGNILYIGMFEENLYYGFGILRNFTDDEIYVGYWKKHLKDGIGKTIRKNSITLSRYSKNIVIQNFDDQNIIEILLHDNHRHLVKFFEFSIKELKKYVSLARILNPK